MSANDTHQDDVKLEKMLLDDGREAEKRVSVDADGKEVTEIFAQEKLPFKLEKRIVRETKNIVVKEVHQTLKDGVVDHEVVYALDDNLLKSVSSLTEKTPEPVGVTNGVLKAQEAVEQVVAVKQKDRLVNGILIAVVVLQLAFLVGYLLLK